jgi:HK97 family phage major capsid protein
MDEYTKKTVRNRDELAGRVAAMWDVAAKEDRKLTPAETASADKMTAEIGELDAELRRAKAYQDAVRNFTHIEDAAAAQRAEVAKREEPAEHRSIGDLWTSSEQWKDYAQRPRGNSGMLSVPFDSVMETRANLLTTTFAGLVAKDRITPSTAPSAQTPLLDLVRTVQVNGNAVEWVFYPAAAPLGTVTAEGAPKTEAALTLTVNTVTLDLIASWAKYSRQFASEPGLSQFVSEALSRGIYDRMEALIATELTTNASIPTTTNTSGTLLAGIRRSIATIQSAGYTPQAVVLNPADYAVLDINVFTATLAGPAINSSFWGVRPIPVGAVPSGTAFVGDFTTGMAWLQRQDVTVYTTDSDISGAGSTAASDFRSNILTTLSESRGKAITHRPEALTKVTGTVVGTFGEQSAQSPSSEGNAEQQSAARKAVDEQRAAEEQKRAEEQQRQQSAKK